MLRQGSSACACAGGTQRAATPTAAAADTPAIALFITSSFPEWATDAHPPDGGGRMTVPGIGGP